MGKKSSRPAGRTHPKAPKTWHERLDEAVNAHFREQKVVCETRFDLLGSMRYVTSWRTEDGKKLSAGVARQVKAFVAGFMANEEYYA